MVVGIITWSLRRPKEPGRRAGPRAGASGARPRVPPPPAAAQPREQKGRPPPPGGIGQPHPVLAGRQGHGPEQIVGAQQLTLPPVHPDAPAGVMDVVYHRQACTVHSAADIQVVLVPGQHRHALLLDTHQRRGGLREAGPLLQNHRQHRLQALKGLQGPVPPGANHIIPRQEVPGDHEAVFHNPGPGLSPALRPADQFLLAQPQGFDGDLRAALAGYLQEPPRAGCPCLCHRRLRARPFSRARAWPLPCLARATGGPFSAVGSPALLMAGLAAPRRCTVTAPDADAINRPAGGCQTNAPLGLPGPARLC